MKVFICWSGGRSRAIAEALRKWLPSVIQAVEPFMSEYIAKGTPWPDDLDEKLRDANAGILCLTRENINEPWIHFEAGALYMKLKQELVCPFLLNFPKSEIPWPLARFQATSADEEDTWKLIETINKGLGENALDKEWLCAAFKMWWKQLEQSIKEAREMTSEGEPARRTVEEILEELVNLSRSQSRQIVGLEDTVDQLIARLLMARDLVNVTPGSATMLIVPRAVTRTVGVPVEATATLTAESSVEQSRKPTDVSG